jgi:hypothetical protein
MGQIICESKHLPLLNCHCFILHFSFLSLLSLLPPPPFIQLSAFEIVIIIIIFIVISIIILPQRVLIQELKCVQCHYYWHWMVIFWRFHHIFSVFSMELIAPFFILALFKYFCFKGFYLPNHTEVFNLETCSKYGLIINATFSFSAPACLFASGFPISFSHILPFSLPW